MTDASFHDVDPGPLTLRAIDAEDLRVISTLAQDAVVQVSDIRYDAKGRFLALLINRFRWEDVKDARREDRPFERIRSLLVVSDVLGVKSDGIDQKDGDLVLELLAINWVAGEDGTGRVMLEFAGDGTFAVAVEALQVDLRDVTVPYMAVSGRVPTHPE